MSEYTITCDNSPPPEAIQAALIMPLSALIENLIRQMLASGELAIQDGVIMPAGQEPFKFIVSLPVEVAIE